MLTLPSPTLCSPGAQALHGALRDTATWATRSPPRPRGLWRTQEARTWDPGQGCRLSLSPPLPNPWASSGRPLFLCGASDESWWREGCAGPHPSVMKEDAEAQSDRALGPLAGRLLGVCASPWGQGPVLCFASVSLLNTSAATPSPLLPAPFLPVLCLKPCSFLGFTPGPHSQAPGPAGGGTPAAHGSPSSWGRAPQAPRRGQPRLNSPHRHSASGVPRPPQGTHPGTFIPNLQLTRAKRWGRT